MKTTNTQSGTNVHEVADGIFRINTPVPPSVIPGGFSFNQFLLAGEEPLLGAPQRAEVRGSVANLLRARHGLDHMREPWR